MISTDVIPRVVPLPRLKSAMHLRGRGSVPFHTHDQAELVFMLQGKISIEVGKTELSGKPGSLLILPAVKPHDMRCKGAWHSICVLFSNHGGILNEGPRVFECGKEKGIRVLLEELSTLYSSKTVVPEIVCDGILLALLSGIDHLENDRTNIEALHPRLAAAVRFLQENASSDVDTEALITSAGASYSHLNTLFRAHYNCAPLKFHQNLRMSMAKRLLLNPYASIAEIAEEVGFEDVNYFCRLFRKIYGIPPGKWRREASVSEGLGNT